MTSATELTQEAQTFAGAWAELAATLFAHGVPSKKEQDAIRAVFYSGGFAMHRLIVAGVKGRSVEESVAFVDGLLEEVTSAIMQSSGTRQ